MLAPTGIAFDCLEALDQELIFHLGPHLQHDIPLPHLQQNSHVGQHSSGGGEGGCDGLMSVLESVWSDLKPVEEVPATPGVREPFFRHFEDGRTDPLLHNPLVRLIFLSVGEGPLRVSALKLHDETAQTVSAPRQMGRANI